MEGEASLGRVEQVDLVELCRGAYPVNLGQQCVNLVLDVRPVRVGQGVVGALNAQLADATEEAVHLVERAFGDLQHAHGVLRVALCLVEPAHLVLQLLTDRQAGGVV